MLVNNAGGWIGDAQFPDAPFEDWSRALDLNLRGPMLATQLAIGPMRRAGGGVVVNVASSAGNESTAYASPEYGAAKAGLIRFTTALGDLEGVRVNCIVPNWILTERAEAELAAMTPEERSRAPGTIPLEVVCDAVADLIGDETARGRVVEIEPPAGGRQGRGLDGVTDAGWGGSGRPGRPRAEETLHRPQPDQSTALDTEQTPPPYKPRPFTHASSTPNAPGARRQGVRP